MSDSAFPRRRRIDEPEREPTVLAPAEADAVFEALASQTARDLVRALCETPAPPSELAERLDTSLQNVGYHVERLTAAGVLEVVDTWYSSRGVEMDVYALASDPVVVRFDDGDGDGDGDGESRADTADVTDAAEMAPASD